jgi:hypothetical protein
MGRDIAQWNLDFVDVLVYLNCSTALVHSIGPGMIPYLSSAIRLKHLWHDAEAQ